MKRISKSEQRLLKAIREQGVIRRARHWWMDPNLASDLNYLEDDEKTKELLDKIYG